MARMQHIPHWLTTLFTALVLLLAVRITMAVDAGVEGGAVLRTYVFWAVVCAAVAHLGDTVIRSVLNYRLVQVAVARVRSRR